jgi:MFS transporter, OFA family, oxalate/formate antiporter
LFWAYISDLTSRKSAFFAMFLIQAILFWTYHLISEPMLLLGVTFAILMCYGGGYGITPVFAADYFGAKNVGPIFGLMLLPWAFPAAFGTLFIAKMRELTGGYVEALYMIAVLMTVAMVLPLLVSPPHGHKNPTPVPVPDALRGA